MGFTMKAEKSSGGGGTKISAEASAAFNENLLDVLGEELENRVAILSGIIDVGVQKRDTVEKEYTKTKDQEAALKSGRSHLSEDETMILTPLTPKKQVIFVVDFPELMVDYGILYPDAGVMPYRALVNGEWWNKNHGDKGAMFAKGVSLSCTPQDKAASGWGYDPKSTITKLANATGMCAGTVDQGFDLGELLGGVFSMDVKAEEAGKYVNVSVKNVSKKHKAVEVPENDIEPFGILFDGEDYSDEILKNIRWSIRNTMSIAENWEDSKLKAQLEEYDKRNSAASKSAKSDDDEDEGEEKPVVKKAPVKKVETKTSTNKKKAPF